MRINSERASLCERSVSPQQGCILGVWRVNRGTFFSLEGRQSKYPASASTRWGKSSHVLHSVKRYYLDAFAVIALAESIMRSVSKQTQSHRACYCWIVLLQQPHSHKCKTNPPHFSNIPVTSKGFWSTLSLHYSSWLYFEVWRLLHCFLWIMILSQE